MKEYTCPLEEITEYTEMQKELKKKPCVVNISGCIDSEKCHVIAGLAEQFPRRVIVTYNDLKAREICEDMQVFEKDAVVYPSKDVIFYSADVQGNAIVKERLSVIKRLIEGEPLTVVMCIDGGVDRLLPLSSIKKNIVSIAVDDTINTDELSENLVTLGYERQGQVSVPGEYSVRGGIIDIFPLNETAPIRIELYGDCVDTIRIFDVDSQRSVESIEEVSIYPATEYILTQEETDAGILKIKEEAEKNSKILYDKMKTEEAYRLKKNVDEFIDSLCYCRGRAPLDSYINFFRKDTVSFFDYFEDDTLFILDEPIRLMEKGEATATEFRESMTGRLENGHILSSQADMIYDYKFQMQSLLKRRVLMLSTLDHNMRDVKAEMSFNLYVKSVNPYNGNFELLVDDIRSWKKNKYRLIIQAGSTARAERVAKALTEDYEIPAFFSTGVDRALLPGEIMVTTGFIHKGFDYPYLHFAVLAENDIFGAERKKKKRKYDADKEKCKIVSSLNDLNYGDYVVHEMQGLGVYRGIEKIEVNKITKDFVKIEYGDGGVLYIPATGLDVIQKYASADSEHKPKLNKMNSVEWKNTKARVKHAVKDLAEELVKLYAIREKVGGYAFGPDTVWQKEFEEQFPFEETEDQIRAIEETKHDMESGHVMDRLICGDVGFGKTEVAIRAAFKAVMDGKQVALLVPTTILAQQHYNTFSSRMAQYGVRVEMLSRFITPAKQKSTIEGLAKGNVDVVIGTHRLLSNDIKIKNLGLLIVDEEQRFGVSHKERIKQIRNEVDVLTLSATPIPRTLHMGLSGIREMSLLEEAPVDRLPIQTFVMEHNDEIIREAINRELLRQGQIYYVSNRVQGIEEVARRVSELVPDANVAYAHGQMSERQLERIMQDFINGEIDVLVATTIVETGLDISNVNTMIIDDADKMGLSQLYQLRGRVGRSNRTSYAFLMYKRDKVLKEVAEKRLQAIKEFTDLGSGFKIAVRDLEIRGAGNLLGAEQSGHMDSVGYDMYCQMLNEAIKECKGELKPSEEFETQVDLDVDAFIPAKYIKNETQKLDVYKRVANVETEEDVSDIRDEMVDRFGDIPFELDNLIRIAYMKALFHKGYVTSIKQNGDSVVLNIFPRAKIKVEEIPTLVGEYAGRLKFSAGTTPYFVLNINSIKKAATVPKTLADKVLTELTVFAEKLVGITEE